MGATADTIWQVPAYLSYLQPQLTDKAIAVAEGKIGYTLPDEYLGLLRKQNGGYIRFSLPEIVHDSIVGIGPHFPSLTEFDWDECQEYVSFPLKGLVPFDGDGHWHICLDYRRNPKNPSITYIDVECDSETAIGDSFSEYLAILRLDVSGQYVLESVTDIDAVLSTLSAAGSLKFDPPDSWAHGFPIHRARIGASASPEWVWISPNTVPRGFVRSDDPRHAELKDRLQGTALRFPELPANSYFFSATDAALPLMLDLCEKVKLAVRPLGELLVAK